MLPNKEDGLDVLVEALLGGSSSDAIERQEKRGQEKFVGSETLPKKFNRGKQSDLESLGVVFGDDFDDLFIFVTLPDGWRKEPTDHSMWSKLVDNEGVEIASIFYKAAFYDRDAFINVSRK